MRPTQALQGGGAPNGKIGQYVHILSPLSKNWQRIHDELRLFSLPKKPTIAVSALGFARLPQNTVLANDHEMLTLDFSFTLDGSVTGDLSVSCPRMSN